MGAGWTADRAVNIFCSSPYVPMQGEAVGGMDRSTPNGHSSAALERVGGGSDGAEGVSGGRQQWLAG